MKVAIPGKGILDDEEADKLGLMENPNTERMLNNNPMFNPDLVRKARETQQKTFWTPEMRKEVGRKNSLRPKEVFEKQGRTLKEKWEKDLVYREHMLKAILEGHTPEVFARQGASLREAYEKDPTLGEKVGKGLEEFWKDPKERQKRSEISKRLWTQLDFKLKWREGELTTPNKPEIYFKEELLNKFFPEEFVYLRDSKEQLKIGGKTPDFVNVSKKKVIEIFGNYWFNLIFFPDAWTPEELIEHYKTYGYECLVLWEDEVYNEEEKNKAKVQELLDGEISRCQMT